MYIYLDNLVFGKGLSIEIYLLVGSSEMEKQKREKQ